MRPLRIAVRVDGDDHIGVGHVARCIPLASAFRNAGHSPELVGTFGDFAAWMILGAGLTTSPIDAVAPTGISPDAFDAAILDSYALRVSDICQIARQLPVATLGEAPRCPDVGVLIDYHLDRAGEPATARLLPGPSYAPIDPRFTVARHRRRAVKRVLITTGGSRSGHHLLKIAVAAVRTAFPGVQMLLAADTVIAGKDIEHLPTPSLLSGALASVDLAVSAAGVTAYELACAGVPAVLVAIAENQLRVTRASALAGTALTVEACEPDRSSALLAELRTELTTRLETLRNSALRSAMARRGPELFDGRGAERTARALLERWI